MEHDFTNELRQKVLKLISQQPAQLTRRDIADCLKIKGNARRDLRQLLAELLDEGVISSGHRRRFQLADQPIYAGAKLKCEVARVDEDGEIWVRPIIWDHDTPSPEFYLHNQRETAFHIGDGVLVQLSHADHDGHWHAKSIRKISLSTGKKLGIFRQNKTNTGGFLYPIHRKDRSSRIHILPEQGKNLNEGDVLQYEVANHLGVRIIKKIGDIEDPRTFSHMAAAAHNLRVEFSEECLAQANGAAIPELGERKDYRHLPLVTIDGADARDFDDAVWAMADEGAHNQGGWRIIVAIADVSYYVPANSPLDVEALKRGNSVYFPDMVIPMLPEALSNGLCSLKPNEDRACLAAEMIISANGKLKSHKIHRGLMRSKARLTYTQVENALHNKFDKTTEPIYDSVIRPLYEAYQSLRLAREKRGTINIHQDEHQIHFTDTGHIDKIGIRPDLESHKLIEEFMIAANIAAAKTLLAKTGRCMLRVHEPPNLERVQSLRNALQPFRIKVPKVKNMEPNHFNDLLKAHDNSPLRQLVHEMVLRTQSAARYSLDELGHYGLSLTHYAHFTSPIRRYSDLVVHRMLIDALKFGDDGYASLNEEPDFVNIAAHISATEREAMLAERQATDRFVAAFYAQHTGNSFLATIVGLSTAGIFVKLDETGAQGFIPKRIIYGDLFRYDERSNLLVGQRSGFVYKLGDPVTVKLKEADAVSTSMIFQLESPVSEGHTPKKKTPKKKGRVRKPGETKSKKPQKKKRK